MLRSVREERHLACALERCRHFALVLRARASLASRFDLGPIRDTGLNKALQLTDEEIARIHSPIGLDLGARTPEETAISIAAEVVQSRWGGSGKALTKSDGPIHAGAPR